MKKLFEKYDLAKLMTLTVIATLVLTWLIPNGTFSGTEFVSSGLNRLGLNDLLLSGVYSLNFFVQQVVFILMIGAFYGILSHTKGYKALISKIAKKLKGKETIVALVSAFVIALFTSISTQTLAVLVFVPFVVTVLLRMGIDKIGAFASTFGAMLVGLLGATYGTEGLNSFVYYLNYYKTVDGFSDIWIRFAILGIGFLIYAIFLFLYLRKGKRVNEIEADPFTIEEVKDKKVKTWPVVVGLVLLAIFMILGYIDWYSNFGIEAFDKFHTWLLDLKVGSHPIISYILGANAQALGTWDLYGITVIMAIVTLLYTIIYRVNLAEVFESSCKGVRSIIKPLCYMLFAFVVFALVYFSPFAVTIINKVFSITSSFNPFTSAVAASVSSFFHVDFGYAGYALGSYLTTSFADQMPMVVSMFSAFNGFVALFAPTSIFLVFGLSYLDVPYKKWMKYIWKFLVIILVILLVFFSLLTWV